MASDNARYRSGGGSNAGYFFGMIGAATFYVQQASGFWPVVKALLKAFVWPAFVVYDILKYIG